MAGIEVLGEHPPHDVFINLDVEAQRDLLSDALIAEGRVTKLHLDDCRGEFLRRTLRTGFASNTGRGEQAPIFSINKRLVESQQRSRLKHCGELRDSSGTHEQRHQSEHESIDCGQRRRSSSGTAADEELMLQEQRLGDDRANAAGAHHLGKSDDQLNGQEEQTAH